ncbi:MAG: hypothetical protein V1728_03825 [Candidatus Micrarchaeota archaeon]
MSEDLEILRARFIKTYADIPVPLKAEIIAVVNNEPYTWNTAYFLISGKQKIGDDILRKLAQIKVL